MSVKVLFFSPNGTTRTIAERMGQALGGGESIDLTRQEARKQDRSFGPEDTVVVALPSYSDRLPLAGEIFPRLKGGGARAVGLVSFGNNHYETALNELHLNLARQGFQVVAMGGFVAAHCIMEDVAAGRPNASDLAEIDAFGAAVADKLACGGAALPTPELELSPVPASPLCVTGDDTCIQCGTCVDLCPVGAIDPVRPMDTDATRCILCHRCVHVCPVNCRKVASEAFLDRMAQLRTLLLQSEKANATTL